MVLAAFVTAWRLAICPTSRSPLSVNPTTDGVVRPPSLFGMICTAPPSSTATQQFVVPKSMPITLPIILEGVLGVFRYDKVPGRRVMFLNHSPVRTATTLSEGKYL